MRGKEMKTIINQQNYKRMIAVGDIHSRIDLLKELVEIIHFREKEDLLIFLGDYCDYRNTNRRVDRDGISGAEVVKYLSDLRNRFPENIMLLKGNHELISEQYFQSNDDRDLYTWKINGGIETLESFHGIEATRKVLVPYIEHLSLYCESKDFVFVHGCIPHGKTIKTATEEELLWGRELESYRGKKTLIAGHSIHYEVAFYRNAIGIDTGCFITGKLSAYDVLNDVVYTATDKKEHRELPLL